MHVSIVFLVRVRCRRKESSRSLSHLLMSFLLILSCSVSRFLCGVRYNKQWTAQGTAAAADRRPHEKEIWKREHSQVQMEKMKAGQNWVIASYISVFSRCAECMFFSSPVARQMEKRF